MEVDGDTVWNEGHLCQLSQPLRGHPAAVFLDASKARFPYNNSIYRICCCTYRFQLHSYTIAKFAGRCNKLASVTRSFASRSGTRPVTVRLHPLISHLHMKLHLQYFMRIKY